MFVPLLSSLQYSPTLKPLLKMIGIGMASYEKWYNSEKDDSVIKQVLQSLWKGREYLQVSHNMTILAVLIDPSVVSPVHFQSL